VLHFHIDYWPNSVFTRLGVPFVTTLHGRLDLPEFAAVYRSFPHVPLVSISNSQRKPIPDLGWAATVYHGMPQKYLEQGDPYHCECLKTGRLLGESLGLVPGQYIVTFQSRFGKAEWLKPYTALTIENLAKDGCQRVDIFCPGFPADCLETLEEIAMEARESFLEHGGKDYRYIPCLNNNPKWIEALRDIAYQHLLGWSLGTESEAELAKRNERATLAEKSKS
jgi:ferrochelatase